MNGFQLTLVGIFIFLLVLGVLIFSGILPGFRAPQGGVGGTVTWWGTLPSATLAPVLEELSRQYKDDFTLIYVEKNPATLNQDFLEALATGRGPDLISLQHDELLKQSDKLYLIPEETFPRRTYQDTFIRGASIAYTTSGVYGLPLYVDPLVLYYNPNLLTNANIARPPKTWTELQAAVTALTKADTKGTLSQSAIALGLFTNIRHAKDIMSLLFLQAGNPLVVETANGPQVVLKESLGFSRPPAGEAIGFFLRFVDPANSLYSWNSGQPEARDAFARGTLAMYLGYASERPRLAQQNPQMTFDAAVVPQREGSARETTFGHISLLAIPRQSRNIATAYAAASALTGASLARLLATAASVAPARLDLVQAGERDALAAVYGRSALIAQGWLDPSPVESGQVIRRLVENVQVGRLPLAEALTQANLELTAFLPKVE